MEVYLKNSMMMMMMRKRRRRRKKSKGKKKKSGRKSAWSPEDIDDFSVKHIAKFMRTI